MRTTQLFVEIVVIGAGVAAWIFLLVLAIFGWQWIKLDNTIVLSSAILVLSLIYVFGVVFDRIADAIFKTLWEKALRAKFFSTPEDYFEACLIVYTHAEYLSKQLEYGRNRIRICRGWTINFAFLLISSLLFIVMQVPTNSVNLVISCTVFFGLMLLGTWWSWRKFTMTEYKKIRLQANHLKKMNNLATDTTTD